MRVIGLIMSIELHVSSCTWTISFRLYIHMYVTVLNIEWNALCTLVFPITFKLDFDIAEEITSILDSKDFFVELVRVNMYLFSSTCVKRR